MLSKSSQSKEDPVPAIQFCFPMLFLIGLLCLQVSPERSGKEDEPQIRKTVREEIQREFGKPNYRQ